MISFEPKFKLYDPIYHVTLESPQGIVLDIRYSVKTKSIEYMIAFGPFSNDCVWAVWADEGELRKEKRFQ